MHGGSSTIASTLTGRSLLSLYDLSRDEILELIDAAVRVKWERRDGKPRRRFEGKTLALIFEKPSTRTRCAFETAFGEEGGYAVSLSPADIHLGSKESLEDTSRVLGRMFDCIQFRGFKQETVETLARFSGVPVYNGLTDLYHPTQILADLMTLREARGTLTGTRIAFIGDGRNNVARSLMHGCSRTGVSLTIGAPRALQPEPEVVRTCSDEAARNGAEVVVMEDPRRAVADADAVYTDVWYSMGEESKSKERKQLLASYQVNADLMAASGRPNTIFMHCLPAVKGNEVTVDVFEGAASRVWDEAENRKHTIKALMLATLGVL